MGKMKYRNMDEFTKVIAKGTVDRSKKIFFPAKTYNGKNGFFIASLLIDNHDNQYLIDEGWFEYNKLDYFKNNSDVISTDILGYLRYPTKKNHIVGYWILSILIIALFLVMFAISLIAAMSF